MPTGEQLKEQALFRLEMSNIDALRVIRTKLAVLYGTRKAVSNVLTPEAFVTADDARRVYDQLENRPRKTSFLGAVFKSEEWEWTGQMVKSLRAGRHAGLLYCWRLK